MGFKIKLPYFKEYKKQEEKILSFSKEFWEQYKEGKKEYLKNKEDKEYKIINKKSYDLYIDYKDYISKFFKLKSQYLKLCMNYPSQTMAAHMTKLAVVYLFDYIKNNNHLNIVRISNVIYDEIVLEVRDDLVSEYENVLGDCMIKAGDVFITLPNLKIKADAYGGLSWYKSKKATKKFYEDFKDLIEIAKPLL